MNEQEPKENINNKKVSKILNRTLKDYIDYVIDIVDGNSNDWFKIKMLIINTFNPQYRSLFSRRHYSTKKHILNDFDREVITYWEKKTGVTLFIDPKKLHPEDWVQKPKTWRLQQINEERAKQKRLREAARNAGGEGTNE